MTTLKKGDSDIACKGLCKVLWSIEADMVDSCLLFITGDPVSLGCWEPEMAVHLSRSKESTKVWRAEIKVPCGINFKYNYFMKDNRQLSADLIWRAGPEFSLSVPINCQENEVLLVRDSWLRCKTESWPLPSWGSWMLDMNLSTSYLDHEVWRASSLGKHEMLKSQNGGPSQGGELPSNSMEKEALRCTENIMVDANCSGQEISERDQPVEEPWLLQSLVSLMDSYEFFETSEQGKVQNADNLGQFQDTKEKVPVGDDRKLTPGVEPTSTVILINSSVCTMQRIAVLEEGKLVELLLEPVKNNVQCDSVYLGVVTKLVPHMGGAFVDIGISRPSLMDIKPNREPFVYPPFSNQVREVAVTGCVQVDSKEILGIHAEVADGPSYDDDDIIDDFSEIDHQDESMEPLQENFEDDEVEDEMVVSNALKITENGSVVTGEADFQELLQENDQYSEEESLEDHLEQENLVDSDLAQLLQEDLQDYDGKSNTGNKWTHVLKGTKVIVQVVKEGLGTKGPALSAYPSLRSRFWILATRCDRIGVSKKITGPERSRLRAIAKSLQPPGFGLTVRTVASGHSLEELHKDLERLVSTWKGIVENAKSAALAADEGVDGAVPVLLHRAMGQTLSVVQDYFNEKVQKMVVDSLRTYHEVTSYLQEIAPDLCERVELHDKRIPIFDEYGIEEEIDHILSKRVPLSNGGSLVIEQTEALVSIDVNGGHGMLAQSTSQERAVLDVNLAAAKQIARELRLRDVGGIIVVDFIDMVDESNRRLVYEEMRKAVERDNSMVKVSELSKHGLMEITRKRVRPSVTFMISEPCTCCHATGRVEALETSFSKIEHEICRLLAAFDQKPDPGNAKSWPRFVLKVDRYMCNYLTSGRRTKLAILSSTLKVWILLKVARGFSRGQFEVKPFAYGKLIDSKQVALTRLQTTEARTYFPNSKLTVFPIKKWKSRGK